MKKGHAIPSIHAARPSAYDAPTWEQAEGDKEFFRDEVRTFQPSAETRSRVSELLQREKTSGLTAEERRELDHYEDLELLMNLAKAREPETRSS